ncbi:MAG TPA: nitrite reductase large subunit NirB [Acidimicrobiales bacterium]|nr:nitrite reductase large subunit NirB [Acidimicrobiales bacterium]
MTGGQRRKLVVVGNGMVGHRLVDQLVALDTGRSWDITVFGGERRPAYDRVGLSSYLTGTTAEELCLPAPSWPGRVGVRLGDPVVAIDRRCATARTAGGVVASYDALVLATGSYPFVPPVPGSDLPGCFVYRTIDDLDRIRERSAGRRAAAVVGGGLLGLEAADGLRHLGLATHVVEVAPRLMPLQVDEGGGAALHARISELGVDVRTDARITGLAAGPDGGVAAVVLDDGTELAVDLVVFAAGIRPCDELARACGLEVGERGGVVVDEACRTSDHRIYAVGECALAGGRLWGLVAPGYRMADAVADQLVGGDSVFAGADLSTKLKLMGVDVASFGDAFGATPGSRSVVFSDAVASVYKRLVLDGDGTRVLGGVMVGDASTYQLLLQMARGDMPTPEHPEQLILPAGAAGGVNLPGVAGLADSAVICSCNSVDKGRICAAVTGGGADSVAAIKAATRAGTTCGGCVPLLADLLRDELTRAGVEVHDGLCEHFAYSRQELLDIVRVHRLASFSELLAGWGTGLGCEVCKPAVASMLASEGNGYILDGEQASLQDTNDHFLANLQRDGTYSVVPRVPGGEITPAQLIAIGQVAIDFGLYTKITGGQRIDLFGARVEQLPAIWARLIDAGMESGHAYGKALRTVKSCVGSTWCRYGVQDSTAMAVRLELRYRGLRAPHKIKAAVSGCARECAEAQGKDVGVIATEKGWNLFVCGNGGMRPQHAVLLCEDLDDETLIRYIDRFLMYYIRTAGRLERTATWLNKLDGGIEHLRKVVVEDSLGLAAELEADMERHVATYECEWAATLADPARVARFRTFVNDDRPDPNIVMVPERGQHRPAFAHEKPTPVEITR